MVEVIRPTTDIDVPPTPEELNEQLGEFWAADARAGEVTFERQPAATSWNRGKNWNYRKGHP